MKKASVMLKSYIFQMHIDFFAFPVQFPTGVRIALIKPENMIDCIERDSRMIERRKGELFARVRRMYNPIKVIPEFKPTLLVETEYKRIDDFPIHAGLKARGFEIVVANTLGALHSGDLIKSVDVVDTTIGRIECKIGGGRLYWAASE